MADFQTFFYTTQNDFMEDMLHQFPWKPIKTVFYTHYGLHPLFYNKLPLKLAFFSTTNFSKFFFL